MQTATAYRTEEDSLGAREVPFDACWGIHSLRAVENFPISGASLSVYPELVAALASVKAAAALANAELGILPDIKKEAILHACTLLRQGRGQDHFVVDMIQGGAGTSTNMNANEVIANLGLDYLGRPRGDYRRLHPNDDVNASQSTNDVYPTAIRLAILSMVPALSAALHEIRAAFLVKAAEFAHVGKVGRTQLQDAVPMTLGAEFRAFAVTVGEDIARLDEAARLLLEVNLGGTAIGTGINAPPGFGARAIAHLAAMTGKPFVQAEDLIEATSDLGAFVTFSSVLKRIAIKLSKICNDLRLLSSGPRAGLAEITLPAVQAGSSIMPGKVNPVIPEVMNQIAFQVLGNDLTVALAAESGQLQLNAMEPIAVLNILQSLRILTRGIETLSRRCVTGITAEPANCARLLANSLALATPLVPILGYEAAATVAKTAQGENCSVLGALERLGITDPAALAVASGMEGAESATHSAS
jgi:aspartate ammonia-lyase